MGAWDYDILDDDAAGDLKVTWNEYVERGRDRDPDFWSPEQIVSFFDDYCFTSKHLSERDVDVARLALGVLFQQANLEIPKHLRADLILAASREASKERLSAWDSPAKRRRVLTAFLASIDAEVVVPPKTSEQADPLLEEVKKWRVFSKQYPRWVKISQGPFGKPDEFFELAPKWFWKVQDFLGDGLYHKRRALTTEGMKYRLMHVAWWLGFLLRMPNDERMALIRTAELKGAESFLIPRP